MKLLDEEKMNHWAYWECRNGNDTPEIRKLITLNRWKLFYCLNINDIEEFHNSIPYKDWNNYHKYKEFLITKKCELE